MNTSPFVHTSLIDEDLDPSTIAAMVRRDDCGAVVVFEGRVRSPSNGFEVLRLEYEIYERVAGEQLRAIAEECAEAHGLRAVAAVHRIGSVARGDVSVVVACAAPSRRAAFDGASVLIDRIKGEVAIWKREVREDGSDWLTEHA